MKVSVKGSRDWGWGLTQGFLAKAAKTSDKKTNYQGAIDLWLATHGLRTVLCLVQFGGTQLYEMPRMYLATPKEIAMVLRAAKSGRGEAVLNEDWTLTKGPFAGTTEKLPTEWKFTGQRIESLLIDPEVGLSVGKKD
jgi:hypothetical protein